MINVLATLIGVYGATLIWLCIERDRMCRRLRDLEAKEQQHDNTRT